MSEFESWSDYLKFSHSVRRKARYVWEDHTQKFLQTVIATIGKRQSRLPVGSIFWRAQQGDSWETISVQGEETEEQFPLPPARMTPLIHSAREGRANAKEIPCLYLSNDRDTAMSEVRPWIGSHVSVGQFKILRDLTLIDCSLEHAVKPIYHCPPEMQERAVWSHIDHAFSKPVSLEETTADYAPTQILAEAFRKNGYDGVFYKSLLGSGFNIALFDVNAAEIVNCCLYKAASLTFAFEKAGNPYWLNRPAQEPPQSVEPNACEDPPRGIP